MEKWKEFPLSKEEEEGITEDADEVVGGDLSTYSCGETMD